MNPEGLKIVFAQTSDDEMVSIADVDPDNQHFCPKCDDVLLIVTAHEREGSPVRKHFRHKGESCGHEDPIHVRMKVFTRMYAESRWPDAVVRDEETDGRIDIGATRYPDVIVQFEESHERWGIGICFECQYKNHSKDKRTTDRVYWGADYSVAWTESHYPTDEEDFVWRALEDNWPTLIPSIEVDYPETPDSSYGSVRIVFPPDACEAMDAMVTAESCSFWQGYRGECGICGGSGADHNNIALVFDSLYKNPVYVECLRRECPDMYESVAGTYPIIRRSRS